MATEFRRLLEDLQQGKRAALDAMMPVLYNELRELAGAYMRQERENHTLQPTALVHEAYLRLMGQQRIDWSNRAQVLGVAARMMRRVLLDHASERNAAKRFGRLDRVELDDAVLAGTPGASGGIEFLDLNRALDVLADVDPQMAAVVELRFFGGLTIAEVSEATGVSEATIEREWATARLWLLRQIREGATS